MSSSTYRTYTSIPKDIVRLGDMPVTYKRLAEHGHKHPEHEGILLWSGKGDIPTIHGQPTCHMNGIGKVRVTGYFSEEGYFGVICSALAPPEWLLRQCPEGGDSHIFGCDLDERS